MTIRDTHCDSGVTLDEMAREALRAALKSLSEQAYGRGCMGNAVEIIEGYMRDVLSHDWTEAGEIASPPKEAYVEHASWELYDLGGPA